ncbi:hypothetical protein ACFX2C_022121 [Malus domestica]
MPRRTIARFPDTWHTIWTLTIARGRNPKDPAKRQKLEKGNPLWWVNHFRAGPSLTWHACPPQVRISEGSEQKDIYHLVSVEK